MAARLKERPPQQRIFPHTVAFTVAAGAGGACGEHPAVWTRGFAEILFVLCEGAGAVE